LKKKEYLVGLYRGKKKMPVDYLKYFNCYILHFLLTSNYYHPPVSNMSAADHADDLIDYEEEDEQTIQQEAAAAQQAEALNGDDEDKKDKKGSYVGIHSTGFRDFLLKPELLRSIVDCGFEHPSEGKTKQKDASLFLSLGFFLFIYA
jgi:hypothetical protein